MGHLTNSDGLKEDVLLDAEPRMITKGKRELGEM